MSQVSDPGELDVELAALETRISELRQAAEIPGATLRPTLEAALVELELAADMLTKLREGAVTGAPDEARRPGAADTERRLLKAVFQDAPAAIFLLETDGTVRRANRQAAGLLGVPPGYVTGKPFTAFVELPGRAAMKTQFSALVRTRRPRRVRCQLQGATGRIETVLTIDLVGLAGEPEPLIVAVAGHTAAAPGPKWLGPARPDGRANASHRAVADRAVADATQRLDLMTAATRLLLENATFNEAVTLQRCARLLAAELTSWVIVDVVHGGQLRRQLVVGPSAELTGDVARVISELDPQPGSLFCEVQESERSRLLAHAEDVTMLGVTDSGTPVLTLLGGTSLLCVPLSDGGRSYGALTLVRRSGERPLEVADLGLVEELGEHVALAIKVDRMFVRRSEVVEALQASLLPREVPRIPDVEIATAYITSTEGLDVGGDFYDVYDSPGGWGLAIGDVQGKGEEAAAVTAMARHAIRVLAHWNADPVTVLRMANEVMLAQQSIDRFVTAIASHLRRDGRTLRITVGSAGHPGPALVRPDGRVRMLPGGGLPIGLFAECEPAAHELELEPGDMLFFFTDGVTEARSPGNAYFESRLTDELSALGGRPAHEVVSALRALVLEFSLNDLRDDMTMIVLRVLEPSA
jgi:serine phosphatase RsbU (regulator of sigma subunit)/PAS domain-containing protein